MIDVIATLYCRCEQVERIRASGRAALLRDIRTLMAPLSRRERKDWIIVILSRGEPTRRMNGADLRRNRKPIRRESIGAGADIEFVGNGLG